MKNEGILKAAEQLKQAIELAHNSNNRSQDVLKAIQEFLKNINSNINPGENSPLNSPDVTQEIENSIVSTDNNEA
ncbi:Uncharacterized [Syntrophomonas zehnderi OL-4]|uniref:Uncharacterized n=1 Tax=Syntrophomonas zehnderi OL-4 TaxID=690567 RepID=A0A0E4GBQ3_9FIRM|nr:hypothetical protein [Syntrophomonas zehnderi]CFX77911.1 Uncharacterized [Syntrophomonas zehnderi OL-4]